MIRARPAPSTARGRSRCRVTERQQQVGDIRAGDQQHEPDRAEQHVERPLHVPGERAAQRDDGQRSRVVVGRMLAAHLLSDRVQLGGGGGDRDAALQPPESAQVLAAPARRVAVQVVADRRPHLGRGIEVPLGVERLERGGHDTHDPVLEVAHDQRAPDDRRIGAEAAAPETIAEKQHAPVIRAVVVGGEAAPERRTDIMSK